MSKISTQQFLEIEDIKEGIIILKNKSLRGVIMVSSLNFALKSEDEQNAIIYQFQNFLNSLDFPIEILVQSRKLNITGYLDKLKNVESKQTNELLKAQTKEYINFISNLVANSQIMSKNFFVVVPFYTTGLKNISSRAGFFKKKEPAPITEEQFQRSKYQLRQKMEFVALGLRRCGLRCVSLNTAELIELFWSLYHPEKAEVGYYPEIPPELLH